MSWSVAPTLPERKYGPAWTTTPTPPARVAGSGWFALVTYLIPLRGDGTLSVVVAPVQPPSRPSFGGSGTLTATVRPHYSLTAAFTSQGSLLAGVARASAVATAFGAVGSLSVIVNDGLTATVVPGIGVTALFSGGGVLASSDKDGLTADVHPGPPSGAPNAVAALAGSGTLTATATAVSPPANPKFDTLSDDFDAGIGANWTKSFANNAAEVTASGGAVRIDHTAASEYNLLQSVNNYDLTGSYAYVQVTDFGNQALASQQVILGLLKDANNRVAFFGGGNQLIVESFTGGVKSTVGTPITLNTTAHRWLRIRESGGTMFFDTAPDGTTWTNRFSQANPWAVTAMAATLTCGNWQAEASASYAIFDNFNIS